MAGSRGRCREPCRQDSDRYGRAQSGFAMCSCQAQGGHLYPGLQVLRKNRRGQDSTAKGGRGPAGFLRVPMQSIRAFMAKSRSPPVGIKASFQCQQALVLWTVGDRENRLTFRARHGVLHASCYVDQSPGMLLLPIMVVWKPDAGMATIAGNGIRHYWQPAALSHFLHNYSSSIKLAQRAISPRWCSRGDAQSLIQRDKAESVCLPKGRNCPLGAGSPNTMRPLFWACFARLYEVM